jgi:hypothetical protein
MNAPFIRHDASSAQGNLDLFAVFHLNLAFSSIEEENRGDVIARCYWPLLELACAHGPIGLEASGFTLEEIQRLNPEWCDRARALIASGRVELIGSGYSQLIGPLVPARVSEANLAIANRIYREILGAQPQIALVNEQAYSSGLVGLYLDAGYRAILMDWDNPAAHHPQWLHETRYLPQRAVGADGRSIAVLWSSTVAFQKLQRFVHGDISLEAYRDYVLARRGAGPRALCLYANDAEIFDFRPGRYHTEERLSGRGEWRRIAEAFATLAREQGLRLVAPTAALALARLKDADALLRLESAVCPVPVKKQRKYNLARWAVTGRDNLAINAACERIYRALCAIDADETAWKELCYLWSSDFRTHITDKRWTAYCERLRQAEERWETAPTISSSNCHSRESGNPDRPRQRLNKESGVSATSSESVCPGSTMVAHDRVSGARTRPCWVSAFAGMTDGWKRIEDRYIDIETPALRVRLDRRRGLAIDRLHFSSQKRAVVGGLPHGHFDDIALQADWYTGDCVFEGPGEHKVTDLEWCEASVGRSSGGDVGVVARIDTPKGVIEKRIVLGEREPCVSVDLAFHWDDWGKGSLRVGHITLLPDAFDWSRLFLTSHNGGKACETFQLHGAEVAHGAPVSFLVSSSFGIGMTEGWAELGDDQSRIRIEVDRAIAPLLGLLTHARVGGSLFCQIALSALELDETRKPSIYQEGPRRIRFSLRAAAPAAQN